MSDVQFTRRALIMGGAAAVSWATLAGMPFSVSAASGSAPYPVLGGGRLIPAALQDYENAMMSGGPPKDGIPAIDAPKFWSAEQAEDCRPGAGGALTSPADGGISMRGDRSRAGCREGGGTTARIGRGHCASRLLTEQ